MSLCSSHLSEDESSHNEWENAIKDEDDSADWTDSKTETESDNLNSSDDQHFQRVKLSTKIFCQQSFLTTELYEEQQKKALVRTASNSEQTSLPDGPLIAKSSEGSQKSAVSSTDHIDFTTSNSYVMVDSPQQIHESMFAAEITGSLRQHLIWKHQDKKGTVSAIMKHKGTAMKSLNPQCSFNNERDYHIVRW